MGRGKSPHSLHHLPGLGPAWSLSGLCTGGDQFHDGAASSSVCELLQRSTLSSLLLQLTRFLQRQSCVFAPPASAAVLRCVVKGQWSCHGAGLSIHYVTSPAGSQIQLRTCPHSYLLPSPASLPLTVSCLSLCLFLNSCLHCALKMKSAV